MQARIVISGMQVDENFLNRAYFSLSLSNFLSFHTLKNAVLRQPCTLECSYLVCKLLMTTCCIVRLRTSLLLLIFASICPIFPLHTLNNENFRQKFLQNHAS